MAPASRHCCSDPSPWPPTAATGASALHWCAVRLLPRGRLGHRAIVLVGDAPYYSRFGFSAEKTAGLRMPGPFERHRLLALELVPGALDGARGLLRPAGEPVSQPNLAVSAA